MKTAIKIISFSLALLLLFPTFAACDSSDNVGESTNAPMESTLENSDAASEAESEEVVLIPRPENNYDSDFFLLIHGDSNIFHYHWVEESSNDVLSQAIFDR